MDDSVRSQLEGGMVVGAPRPGHYQAGVCVNEQSSRGGKVQIQERVQGRDEEARADDRALEDATRDREGHRESVAHSNRLASAPQPTAEDVDEVGRAATVGEDSEDSGVGKPVECLGAVQG